VRDVIEEQPSELLDFAGWDIKKALLLFRILDFAGWDIKKALLLFRKSNPPLLE